MQKIVIINPLVEKADAILFLVVLIIDLNLHIIINIIEIINKIVNEATTIKHEYPSIEECFLSTKNNPINEIENDNIDKSKIEISTHFDE